MTQQKIPTGYKLTEVGVIPTDWEVKKLGEIGDVMMCRRVFNHETQNKGKIPFYKIGTFGKKADAYISEDLYNMYLQKFSFPKKGDILISAAGTIGRTIVYDGKPGYFQDSNIVWINNNEKLITNNYLFYVFKIVKYNTEGGTIQRLYNSIIKSTFFSCPPLTEQTLIATTLSNIDTLISQLDKLITKKKLIKQGAMQKLLTPKKDWEVKKLGEIGQVTGAGVDKKIKENEETVRLLNYMDVYRRDFIYSNELNHWVTAPKSKLVQCSVLKGDVFFTPSSELQTDIAHSAVAMEDIDKATYSYHIMRLRIEEDWDLKFKAYIFKTRFFYNQAEKFAEGSGKRYVISLTRFRELEVYYPKSKAEQTRIATILFDIDDEIHTLEEKKAKYEQIKQGAMQQLLTGKIRLK